MQLSKESRIESEKLLKKLMATCQNLTPGSLNTLTVTAQMLLKGEASGALEQKKLEKEKREREKRERQGVENDK